MGKKSKRKQSSNAPSQKLATKKDSKPTLLDETPDNLHFEDPFEDEFEEEEVMNDEMDEGLDENEMKEDSTTNVQSWNPLTSELDPGTKLEVDETAYKMHHSIIPEWPSLSFDIIRDNLGESRTRFPHSVIVATGSQADRADRNKLTIMKLSDLCRTSAKNKTDKDLEDEILGEEYDKEDDSDEEEDDDEDINTDPILEHFNLKHNGGVNRVRAMPQRSEIVATWSDAGVVNMYNIGGVLDSFERSAGRGPKDPRRIAKDPFFVYSGHASEGYAMDWSRVNAGQLATGDCEGNIHIWTPSEGGLSSLSTSSFNIQKAYEPSGGNIDQPSIEDLQWSPTEGTVFASAECGGYIKIFDTRCSGRPMLTNKIHENNSDVNVISWNPIISNLLASGGDDGKGTKKLHMLRNLTFVQLESNAYCFPLYLQAYSRFGTCVISNRLMLHLNPSLDLHVTRNLSLVSNGIPRMNP
jgi:ribosome assembly protein RRB1